MFGSEFRATVGADDAANGPNELRFAGCSLSIEDSESLNQVSTPELGFGVDYGFQ